MSEIQADVRRKVKLVSKSVRNADYMRKYRREYKERAKYVNCVLSTREYLKLAREAERHGKKTTAFLREAALAYLEKKYLVPENQTELLNQSIILLRKAGHCFNQIAKKVNTWDKARRKDVDLALEVLNQVEDWMTAMVKNPTEDGN